ncbi:MULTISPECIES: DUF4169 family protein [Methylobacterium]|jgi:hypothetical protein|uniref:DUF4169 family protein n=1 Tax=Methylobacterium TaxID=407 RepID=UPI0003450F7D|nr:MULTISPECIES: DUF4169 family protein [Methylobacterium]MBN4097550.1 DUF4169 family protein [Methylobacterium sp. OT2]UIN35465.1 DUF4169 family protein [Methylobacterium oryzae]SEG54232.1 protein of unknown function [Methylobacterium sp. 190mf]SEO99704.1 protein of unknown function [Methylobacterium sp. UNC300MFChir4.1]SFE63456.1 protein of unknown function [Methylobacterium sp. 13MFTsu3.1M2]
MAEIINLRQVRKAKARAEADTKAEANRIAFGQPKKARTLQQRRKALETERHEGHRLERGEPDPAD